MLETQHGVGRNLLVLMSDPEMYETFSKILYVHSIIVMVAVSSVKVSIAFFLLRFSPRRLYSRYVGLMACKMGN